MIFGEIVFASVSCLIDCSSVEGMRERGISLAVKCRLTVGGIQVSLREVFLEFDLGFLGSLITSIKLDLEYFENAQPA